jgi:hypothetical protein
MNLIFHDLLGMILKIYIDDVIVKSDSMDRQRLALERMHRYGLKINLLKYAFGVSASKFLGFIISINCSRHNVKMTCKNS